MNPNKTNYKFQKFLRKTHGTRTWVPKMSTFSIRKRRYIDNTNPLSGNGLRLFFTWKMLLKVLRQQDSFSSWNQCNEIWESLHQSRKPTIFERSSTKVRESVSFAHTFLTLTCTQVLSPLRYESGKAERESCQAHTFSFTTNYSNFTNCDISQFDNI